VVIITGRVSRRKLYLWEEISSQDGGSSSRCGREEQKTKKRLVGLIEEKGEKENFWWLENNIVFIGSQWITIYVSRWG
jgi:hypothetical protein